jgi:hypothetical protein
MNPGSGGPNQDTGSDPVGGGAGVATSANAGAEAISAAANAASAFNNFASTIEEIVTTLGINSEEGEQLFEKVVTTEQLQSDLASLLDQLDEHSKTLRDIDFRFAAVVGRLDVLHDQLSFFGTRLDGIWAQLGRLTDPYTAPERLAEPPPGVREITQ